MSFEEKKMLEKNQSSRRFKVLKNLGKAKKGSVIQCRVDSNGVPLDEFWRARLNDNDIEMLSFENESTKLENKIDEKEKVESKAKQKKHDEK